MPLASFPAILPIDPGVVTGPPPPPPVLTAPEITAVAVNQGCDCQGAGCVPFIQLTVTNETVFNLVGPLDASFESGIGSAVGAVCLLSDSTTESLDGLKSLEIQFTGTGSQTSCTITLGPYPLLPLTTYTVMANFFAQQLGCDVAVALQFYDETDAYLAGDDITASGTDTLASWLTDPGISASGVSPLGTDHGYILVTLSGLPPGLNPPVSVNVTPTGATGTVSWGYQVTAVNGIGESLPSPMGMTQTGVSPLTGSHYNALSWSAVTGATEYNIYRGQAPTCALLAEAFASCAAVEAAFAECVDLYTEFFGTAQYIGSSSTTSFNDTGLAAGMPVPTENTTGEIHFMDEVGIFEGVQTVWSNIPVGGVTILRSDGQYVLGASPLYPLVVTGSQTVTIDDYTAPYGLPSSYTATTSAGGASSTPSPATEAVMGQAPDSCTLYRRTGWAKEEDEPTGVLLDWLSGIGEMMQALDNITTDSYLPDGTIAPGWSQVLDINRCPTDVLPWLGQFIGARLPPGLRDDQMRWQIEHSPSWARGSVAAIESAANYHLLPGYTATLEERTPDPYSLTIIVPDAGVIGDATCRSIMLAYPLCSDLPEAFATCADMWSGVDAIVESINAAIPAGLIATIEFV